MIRLFIVLVDDSVCVWNGRQWSRPSTEPQPASVSSLLLYVIRDSNTCCHSDAMVAAVKDSSICCWILKNIREQRS